MELTDWMVAGGLFIVGLMAAIAIYWMRSDPETRPYLPGVAGLFNLGRMRAYPDPAHERDKSDPGKKDDRPESH